MNDSADIDGAVGDAPDLVPPELARVGGSDGVDDSRSQRFPSQGKGALWAEDVDTIISKCASYASRGLSPGVTRDDLLQEGRLAVIVAMRDDRVPTDAEHRSKYIARRVLGAMIDLNRANWKQQPIYTDELDDDAPRSGELSRASEPDRMLQLRQVVDRLKRLASPRVWQCMEMLADNDGDEQAIAWKLGISPSRLSQCKRKAREIASRCW